METKIVMKDIAIGITSALSSLKTPESVLVARFNKVPQITKRTVKTGIASHSKFNQLSRIGGE